MVTMAMAEMRVWNGGGANALASNTNNWSGGILPVAGDDVVISSDSGNIIWDGGVDGLTDTVANWNQQEGYSGTVTFRTVYPGVGDFTNFTINGNAVLAGGIWTHDPNTNAEISRLCVTIAGDLSVSQSANIGTLGLGYKAGAGPGGATGGNGATHGGRGGNGPTTVYGSIFAPENLGSGGNSNGGGAIRLVVGGELNLDGIITASTINGSYSGAGGSIFITAGSVTGAANAVIRANGTPNGSSYYGGSGGRVAVILTDPAADFSSFQGGVQAYGGWVGGRSGAAGTVYLETAAQGAGHGTLIIDNKGGFDLAAKHVYTIMPGGTDMSVFDEVIIRENGYLAIGSGSTIDFNNVNLIGESATKAHMALLADDAVIFPQEFVFSGYTLNLNVPFTVAGNWRVASGGRLSHSAGLALDLALNGNLTIDTGGQINVDGRNGTSGGLGSGTTSGYGGLGGDPASMGASYGSILAPAERGSGSGGGGLIKLVISGALTNNGVVTSSGGGKASGGGINITAGTIGGTVATAAIRATGGSGDNGYSGGGGRVAVTLTTPGADFDAYAGTLSAFGGHSYYPRRGAAGTVYRELPSEASGGGTVTVDNNGYTNAYTLASLTSLPASTLSTENLRGTQWHVIGKGKVGLVKDEGIDTLTIAADSYMELSGHILSVNGLTIGGTKYGPGFYSAAMLNDGVSDNSGGSGLVLVKGRGTTLIVR